MDALLKKLNHRPEVIRTAAPVRKVSVGKSCIRFTRLDDLNFDVVAELVRRAADLRPSAGSGSR